MYEATHHTHHTQRLNISNVGQLAGSFQGNYSSTFLDACQYLRDFCGGRIPRSVFSGRRVSEAAQTLSRSTIQSEQQRAEAEAQSRRFLPPRSGRASRRAPPESAAGAGAARAGAGRRRPSWGVRADPAGPKSAAPSPREPSQRRATRGGGDGSQRGSSSSSGGRARGAGSVTG